MDPLAPPLKGVGLALGGLEPRFGRKASEEIFEGVPGMVILVHQVFDGVAAQLNLLAEFLVAKVAKLPYEFFTVGGDAVKGLKRLFPEMADKPFAHRYVSAALALDHGDAAVPEDGGGRFIGAVVLRVVFGPY